MVYIDDKPDLLELYHHGIKGQEWGVKNGPPYPLDRATKREAYGSSKERLSNKQFKERVRNFNKNCSTRCCSGIWIKSICKAKRYKGTSKTWIQQHG